MALQKTEFTPKDKLPASKVNEIQDAIIDNSGQNTRQDQEIDAVEVVNEQQSKDIATLLASISATEADIAKILEQQTQFEQSIAAIKEDVMVIAWQAAQEKLEEVTASSVIDIIKVGETILPINEKTVVIPIASDGILGVLASSFDENKISIKEDGTAEVNSLNITKLVQTDGDTIVFDGGDSNS